MRVEQAREELRLVEEAIAKHEEFLRACEKCSGDEWQPMGTDTVRWGLWSKLRDAQLRFGQAARKAEKS